MFLSPVLGLFMQPLDIRIELVAIDSPDAPPTDLYRRQFSGSNQGVDLGHADTQISGHVLESKKARFDAGRGLRRSSAPLRSLLGRHSSTIAPVTAQGMDLVPFAVVCGQARATASRRG